MYAKNQEKEESQDETVYTTSLFREKPNPIWQSEEVTPGKLLTDAQVTPEEITSEEQHYEEETYGKGEVEHYNKRTQQGQARRKQVRPQQARRKEQTRKVTQENRDNKVERA